ncbi:MAG: hypothetical protein ACJZ9B_04860 [Coraliomargaritaceae bacterium]
MLGKKSRTADGSQFEIQQWTVLYQRLEINHSTTPSLKKNLRKCHTCSRAASPDKATRAWLQSKQCLSPSTEKTLNTNIQIQNSLIRTRFTQTQTSLTKEQRKENIRGAFALSPNIKLDLDKKIYFSRRCFHHRLYG